MILHWRTHTYIYYYIDISFYYQQQPADNITSRSSQKILWMRPFSKFKNFEFNNTTGGTATTHIYAKRVPRPLTVQDCEASWSAEPKRVEIIFRSIRPAGTSEQKLFRTSSAGTFWGPADVIRVFFVPVIRISFCERRHTAFPDIPCARGLPLWRRGVGQLCRSRIRKEVLCSVMTRGSAFSTYSLMIIS